MQIKTFLGANTPYGFSSLFDELYNPYKDGKFYIIKGGPGTGKSSLMKKLADAAEAKGLSTERIYCSSDPDSLDGVMLPSLSLSVADATAPHVVEPRFHGAGEYIINMGQFWNEDELFAKRGEIKALSVENSMYHRSSESCLVSAGGIRKSGAAVYFSKINKEKINSYAVRFAARETPKKKNSPPGIKKRRFLSAITPRGKIFFSETFSALCSRLIAVEDEFGEISSLLCERIGELAAKNGYEVIFCLCPMKKGITEHLIIPEIGTGIVTVNSFHGAELKFDRVIHTERFLFSSVSESRNKLLFCKKLSHQLIDEAVFYLRKAKETHDRLEKLYIDSMDFQRADRFTRELTERLLLF